MGPVAARKRPCRCTKKKKEKVDLFLVGKSIVCGAGREKTHTRAARGSMLRGCRVVGAVAAIIIARSRCRGRGRRGLCVKEVHARVEFGGCVHQPHAAAHGPGGKWAIVRVVSQRRAVGRHGAVVERGKRRCRASKNFFSLCALFLVGKQTRHESGIASRRALSGIGRSRLANRPLCFVTSTRSANLVAIGWGITISNFVSDYMRGSVSRAHSFFWCLL